MWSKCDSHKRGDLLVRTRHFWITVANKGLSSLPISKRDWRRRKNHWMGRLVSLFGGISVAPRLQFLPDFSLLCRAKGFIFFRPNRLRRTHNPLVLGSNPSGPTNQPIDDAVVRKTGANTAKVSSGDSSCSPSCSQPRPAK